MSQRFKLLALLSLVGITHGLLVLVVIYMHHEGNLSLLRGDSISYYDLAVNWAKTGHFSRYSSEPFLWEAYRTPGYPAMILASMRLLNDYSLVLVFHLLLAVIAAYCIFDFTLRISANRKTAYLALLIFSILPNSIGLNAMLLTDAPSAYLFVISLSLLYKAYRLKNVKIFLLAVFILLINQLIRPSLSYFGFVLFVVAIVFEGRFTLRSLLIGFPILILLLLVPVTLSYRMASDHKVATVSMKGAEALRNYFIAADIAQVTGRSFSSVSDSIQQIDLEAANESNLGTKESRLFLVQKDAVSEYFKQNPVSMISQSARESIRQLFAPQEFVFHALSTQANLTMRIIGFILNAVFIGLAFIGMYHVGREDWKLVFGFTTIAVYLILINSLSHKVGARLRLPVDLAIIPLVAIGLKHLSLKRTVN